MENTICALQLVLRYIKSNTFIRSSLKIKFGYSSLDTKCKFNKLKKKNKTKKIVKKIVIFHLKSKRLSLNPLTPIFFLQNQ